MIAWKQIVEGIPQPRYQTFERVETLCPNSSDCVANSGLHIGDGGEICLLLLALNIEFAVH